MLKSNLRTAGKETRRARREIRGVEREIHCAESKTHCAVRDIYCTESGNRGDRNRRGGAFEKISGRKALLLGMVLLIAMLFLPGGAMGQEQVYAATATLNSTEVTLYAIDDWAAEYISIPSGYKQSFTIKVNGKTSTLDWTSEFSDLVYVDSKGVIRISKIQVYNLTTGEYNGEYWYDLPIKLTAKYGSQTLTITVTIKDYTEVYAQNVAQNFIDKKITSSMTDMQKLKKICAYVSAFKYSEEQYTMTGMLVTGGGDCWAGAETINYLCELAGITSEYHAEGGDLITLSGGHMNNVVLINDVVYVVDATPAGSSSEYIISKVTNPYSYEVKDDGTLKITGYTGLSETVKIPSKIDGMTVTELDEMSFYGHFEIKKIVMPDTITKIGEYAFYTCINLKTVILSESLTEIPYGAFSYTNISKIVIPDSVTKIGEYAFFRYTDWGTPDYIELPDTIKSISTDLSDSVVLYHGSKTKWKKVSFSSSSYKPSSSNVHYSTYGVVFKDSSICIGVGETQSLTRYTASSSLTWSSSDSSVVSVSSGKITAKKKGTATITVTAKNNGVKTGSATITVTVKKAQTITADDSITITYGDSATAIGAKCKGSAKLSYSSSKTSVVKVSSSGKITPVAAGSATITITSAETSTYAPATVKVKVKVSKKSIKECNLIFMKTGSISDSESDDYIAIADGTTILKEDVDYTRSTAGASFSSSNMLTSAYIKVTGKGNYTGTATLKSSAISATSVLNSAYRTTSGVKLTWKKETGAMGYRIYRKKGSGDYTLVKTIKSYSTTSWTDTDVSTSSGYTYYVRAFTKNSSGKVVCAKKSNTKSVSKFISTPTLSAARNTSSGISVTWKKVSGASKYFVYRKTSSGSWKKVATVSAPSYTDTDVSNGTQYWYTVRCATSDGKGIASGYDKTGKTTVRLTTASLSSVKNSSSKSMTVKWSKKSGVTGYQIQYCASSSFASGSKTVTVSGASATSKTIGSLTKGKTYYVRIRTYKTVSGTKYYSAWSASKSVKISK